MIGRSEVWRRVQQGLEEWSSGWRGVRRATSHEAEVLDPGHSRQCDFDPSGNVSCSPPGTPTSHSRPRRLPALVASVGPRTESEVDFPSALIDAVIEEIGLITLDLDDAVDRHLGDFGWDGTVLEAPEPSGTPDGPAEYSRSSVLDTVDLQWRVNNLDEEFVDSLASRLATQRFDALATLSTSPERVPRNDHGGWQDSFLPAILCGGVAGCFPECGGQRKRHRSFIFSPDLDVLEERSRSCSASTVDPGSALSSGSDVGDVPGPLPASQIASRGPPSPAHIAAGAEQRLPRQAEPLVAWPEMPQGGAPAPGDSMSGPGFLEVLHGSIVGVAH